MVRRADLNSPMPYDSSYISGANNDRPMIPRRARRTRTFSSRLSGDSSASQLATNSRRTRRSDPEDEALGAARAANASERAAARAAAAEAAAEATAAAETIRKDLAANVHDRTLALSNERMQFLTTELSEISTDIAAAEPMPRQWWGTGTGHQERSQKIEEWKKEREAMQAELDKARKEVEKIKKQDPKDDIRSTSSLTQAMKNLEIKNTEQNQRKDIGAIKGIQRDIDLNKWHDEYRQPWGSITARIYRAQFADPAAAKVAADTNARLEQAKAVKEASLLSSLAAIKEKQLKQATVVGSNYDFDAVNKVNKSLDSWSSRANPLNAIELAEFQKSLGAAIPSFTGILSASVIKTLRDKFGKLNPTLRMQLNTQLAFIELLDKAAETKKPK